MIFKESKTISQQIAERICDEILQGKYAENERIPSVREYASIVEVNANTVVRTYEFLQNQEVIYNKRGMGYFVAAGAMQKIFSIQKTAFLNEELPEFFKRISSLKIPISEIETMYEKFLKSK